MKIDPHQNLRQRQIMVATVAISVCLIVLAIVVGEIIRRKKSQPQVSPIISNMRAVRIALEAYHLENNAYPPMIPMRLPASVEPDPDQNRHYTLDFRYLTTPTAHLLGKPPDVFSPDPEKYFFGYFVGNDSWFLYSSGPDRIYQFHPWEDVDVENRIYYQSYLTKHYDPTNGSTNGTASSGDIIIKSDYVGQSLPLWQIEGEEKETDE